MSGFVRKDERTGTWRVRWRVGGRNGKEYSRSFKTKREATAYLAKVIESMNTGSFVAPDAATFAETFDAWIVGASSRLRPATADGYRRVFDRYARETVGQTKLQALNPLQLDHLYSELLAKGLSPTTVAQCHRLLHKVLADCFKKGLVPRNIAEAASPPRPPKPAERRLKIWTPQEITAFLRSVEDDRLYALWRLYAVSGCRRREPLAAVWDDIDVVSGRWEIKQSLGVMNGSPILSLTKSGRGRVVRLDPATVAALRAHRKRQLEERMAAGGIYRDTGLVFCKEDGTQLHPNIVSRFFYRRRDAAGLPRIRLHDVRVRHEAPCCCRVG